MSHGTILGHASVAFAIHSWIINFLKKYFATIIGKKYAMRHCFHYSQIKLQKSLSKNSGHATPQMELKQKREHLQKKNKNKVFEKALPVATFNVFLM